VKHNGIELSNYPICDTDIWVDIVLAKEEDLFFERYGCVLFSDVVEKEILRFGNSKSSELISKKFIEYKCDGKVIVIKHSDIDEENRMLLEKQLFDTNFQFAYGLADTPHEKDKGEIVSAIYAEFFDIPFLISNDGTFKKGNRGRQAFPFLVVKNLREILKELLGDSKKIFECESLINDNRALMEEGNRIYNNEEASQEQIDKLIRKFEKHL
jgi:hypothetical protein